MAEVNEGKAKKVRILEMTARFQDVVTEFSRVCMIEQPPDLINFAVEYFTRLQRERIIDDASTASTSKELGVDSYIRDEESNIEPVSYVRRKSVFAEAYDPEDDLDDDEISAIVFPKSEEQRAYLHEAVKDILLFRNLEPEQLSRVVDAMFEKRVQPGDFVIRQGDDGDNFYVIETGVYSAIIDGTHVHTYDNSGVFGELALLYNQPRAASVRAETAGILWAVERMTFRRLVLKGAYKKRKMYESLLDSVPLLKALQPFERMNLADALVTKPFIPGEQIIKQGDYADGMYFIEEGTVSVKMEQEGGDIEVAKLSRGQYFGELALVTQRPRAASVYAITAVKVAFLNTAAFNRILGFLTDVLKRNVELYEETFQTTMRNAEDYF